MTAQSATSGRFDLAAPPTPEMARMAAGGALCLAQAYDRPLDETTTTIERRPYQPAPFSLLADMVVERGTKADWDKLHHLHYKNAETLPIGPKFYRLDLHGETIGALVTSSPKGLLAPRHAVFPKLKPGSGESVYSNTHRYHFINANFRVVSRFVIDTMFRGIGCGYRMMNLVSRQEGLRFMEIQSSMSKFNLFGQKAGFQFARPMNASKFEVGLKFFRQNFAASPQDFEAIVDEIQAKSPAEQARILELCKEFYYKHSALEKVGNNAAFGEQRVANLDIRGAIKQIQQIALATPMYGVYVNPDLGREIPASLALAAFDNQAPNEKLRL